MSLTYFHKFEVRWSDVDANRCLSNSAYMQYALQTRMGFMNKHKMGLSQLNRWGIGLAILTEDFYFFNEIYADQEVYVTIEITGLSQDADIYEFTHKFYLPDGKHCATSRALGIWMDTMLRKITTPPDDVLQSFGEYKKDYTRLLTKEDLRNIPIRPQNEDPSIFLPKKWTKIKLR